jgi:hypothetical protein
MWDDERIKAINSDDVAAALPHEPIIVITESIDSAVTQLFTSVLSATVPEFNATVRSLVDHQRALLHAQSPEPRLSVRV